MSILSITKLEAPLLQSITVANIEDTYIIGDLSTGLHASQGDRKGSCTGGTCQGSGLGWNNELEVGKGIFAGQQPMNPDISNEEVGHVSYQVGKNQVRNVREGTSKVVLGSNGGGNQ